MAGTIDETIDVYCVSDFLARMPTVSGRVALAHRLARRLSMPRGIWPWAQDDGTDLRQFVLSKVPPQRIARATIIECEKDEQVESIDVIRLTRTDRTITQRLQVNDGDGPFDFTLTITEAAAQVSDLVA